jgi:hypothetical protein
MVREKFALLAGLYRRVGELKRRDPVASPKRYPDVHRVDFSVYFRRIEREEYAMLSALRAGKSIAAAIECAFSRSSIPEFDRGVYVKHCFETWGALGWFCQSRAEHLFRGGK